MKLFLQKAVAVLVAYGPWGLFLLGVVDSMGVPLPTAMDAMVIAIAVKSSHDPRHACFAAFMALLGSLAGNIILFQMARQGTRLLRRAEPSPGKRRRFQEWFGRYGLLTVFIPAVTPILPLPLKIFVISAGALRTPFVRFLAVIVVARTIRYFGEAYLGVKLGQDAEGFLRRNGWTIIGVVILMASALLWLIRFTERRRATAPTPSPQ